MENNKVVFSQVDGTIVKVDEGFILIKKDGKPQHGQICYARESNSVYKYSYKDPGSGVEDIVVGASFSFKTEGVPLLVEKTEIQIVDSVYGYTEYEAPSITTGKRDAFIQGYNAHAETHPFTEDDMKRAWELGYKFLETGKGNLMDFIQQLRQPQIPERLELDVVEYEYGHVDDYSKPHGFDYRLKSDGGIIYY